eukprot:1606944-Rhodomonas_salina.1
MFSSSIAYVCTSTLQSPHGSTSASGQPRNSAYQYGHREAQARTARSNRLPSFMVQSVRWPWLSQLISQRGRYQRPRRTRAAARRLGEAVRCGLRSSIGHVITGHRIGDA